MKEYLITQNAGIRIDKSVAELDSEFSRMRIQKLIEEDKIKVNGKSVKSSYKVSIGDKIQIEETIVKQVEEIKAEELPIEILYEDTDIILVNKPKGMVVHPAIGNLDGTLVNCLMSVCKGSLSGIGGKIRPGIVHRLDKDTSGVIIVAKNDKSHISLSKQIQNREMRKTYIALVRGVISEEEATINMPIARSKRDRKKMDVDKNGKEAITHFKVLKRYADYTLLEVNIETGRTHQIRVHLSYIGYPIVGDSVYSNGKNTFNIEGQMLHAKSLEFKHPITSKNMKIEAKLPEYFEKVLEKLEISKI